MKDASFTDLESVARAYVEARDKFEKTRNVKDRQAVEKRYRMLKVELAKIDEARTTIAESRQPPLPEVANG